MIPFIFVIFSNFQALSTMVISPAAILALEVRLNILRIPFVVILFFNSSVYDFLDYPMFQHAGFFRTFFKVNLTASPKNNWNRSNRNACISMALTIGSVASSEVLFHLEGCDRKDLSSLIEDERPIPSVCRNGPHLVPLQEVHLADDTDQVATYTGYRMWQMMSVSQVRGCSVSKGG